LRLFNILCLEAKSTTCGISRGNKIDYCKYTPLEQSLELQDKTPRSSTCSVTGMSQQHIFVNDYRRHRNFVMKEEDVLRNKRKCLIFFSDTRLNSIMVNDRADQ
jgi:hypothetical protein